MSPERSNHFVLNGLTILRIAWQRSFPAGTPTDVVVVMTKQQALTGRDFGEPDRVRVVEADRADEGRLNWPAPLTPWGWR